MLNPSKSIILLAGMVLGLLSCGKDHNDTGTEFAPNMYNSVGYEPMTQLQGDTNKINPLGMNMRLPVAGTVSRKMYSGVDSLKKSFLSQELVSKTIPNDSISYSEALLNNPLVATPENIEEGKLQYERFCQHCHGETGKGDGIIVVFIIIIVFITADVTLGSRNLQLSTILLSHPRTIILPLLRWQYR